MNTKTSVYDLTGKVLFSRYISQGDSETKLLDSEPLRDLLIEPADLTNKKPYLQDRNNPKIEDFHQEGMLFDYSGSHFLHEILDGELDKNKMFHLMNYFQYQNSLLRSKLDDADSHIILVPDEYDAEKQERILRVLRSCGLPNRQTLLLWRSIAACMGAENHLRQLGAEEGNQVVVIDAQTDGKVMLSKLTLKRDGDFLVPCRKAFVRGKSNYMSLSAIPCEPVRMANETREFWRHTWNRAGNFIVPVGSQWAEYSFADLACFCNFPSSFLNGVDFFIVIGSIQVNFPRYVNPRNIIQENRQDLCAIGAGRFSNRQRNGLPTYFDECEPLVFIVQDIAEETITPVELIPGNEFCKGGSEIIGTTIDRYYLEKGNTQVNFLLNVGEVNAHTHLRELVHEFGLESSYKQKLTLHPSMIPGQGIAKVEVEASPLLQENVILDFLNMKWACDEHGIRKTIAYLQKTLKRSYPIDFPDVKSDGALWDRMAVESFMKGGYGWDSGMFAKSRWPNINSDGIERFQRINVFGTDPQNRLPVKNETDFDFDGLFTKIALDFQNPSRRKIGSAEDYIRLAAWTYQAGNPIFQTMVAHVLRKVREKAQNNGISISRQEFTLCANILTLPQQIDFIQSFMLRCKNAIQWARQYSHGQIRGVDDWLRAFSEILMYNKDVLQEIESSQCYLCMNLIIDILDSYIENCKDVQYVKIIIKSLLFLLKRRKYDRTFLRDINGKEYIKIKQCGCRIQEYLIYQGIHSLTRSLMDFMDGKGTLEGIPVI